MTPTAHPVPEDIQEEEPNLDEADGYPLVEQLFSYIEELELKVRIEISVLAPVAELLAAK